MVSFGCLNPRSGCCSHSYIYIYIYNMGAYNVCQSMCQAFINTQFDHRALDYRQQQEELQQASSSVQKEKLVSIPSHKQCSKSGPVDLYPEL